ncbi:MAG TPA: ABC transporter permease [Vicinamibacterales bacterium]|nr:ABC transporter permease [Vicinamibacterales bacterium]
MNGGPIAVSRLDWKLGARLLLKYPALTIIGGLSLAGAIAIGAVGIEVADELLYKRLPFDEGGRVVRLETQDTAASRVEPRVLHDFSIWRRSLKTVVELGAARVSERNVLTGEGRVESLRVAEITASAFPLTRVPPLLGRPLQPTDEMQGAASVVVLGYDVWQRQFLQDPAIIGRVVTVGRTPRTVVGVMPPRFGFPHDQQAWVPLPVHDAPPREGPAVQVFGRLADGARWQDAAAELDVVSARLAADQTATHAHLRTRVRAFAGRTPGDPLRLEDLAVHAIVLLLLGAVSANVATLIFARTAMRESEMVVRHALGASRTRVIAQIVTEGLVLALAAAVLGLVVAQTTVRYAWARASQIIGDGLPFWVDLKLEPVTVAYALLLALLAAVLIGLLPALKATRASVQRGLQEITSTGGTMKFGGMWSFIVGAQVACTLLFVPAAVGIFTNTFNSQSRSAEFPAKRYLTFHLSMDNEALAGEQDVPDDRQIDARRARAYEAFAARLREEPGVTHIAHGDRLPTMSPEWVAVEMEEDGVPPARLQGNYEGGFAMAAVGAGYHDAFGAKIVAGRGLQAADAGTPNGPVVVNQAFMRVVARNPVGARVRTLQRDGERELGSWHEIVGVVTDMPTLFPADWGEAAYIYRAASAAEFDPVVVAVRVAGDAAPLAPRVAALARQVDASLHLREIVTLDDIVAREQMRMVGGTVIFASVLLVAVVFSAAGLYALMAVAVARRTREIGIRVALGANPRHLLRSVFARAGRQLLGGIIAGNSLILLLAWRADSLTADLLVSSAITSVIMAAVGVLACAAPARRALRIQPTEALREG